MDEILCGQPRWMDSPAFENGHALLHPQQRFLRVDLRQQEPRPSAVARVHCEQLGKRGFPLPDFWGRGTIRRMVEGSCTRQEAPSVTATPMSDLGLLGAVPMQLILPCICRGGEISRAASAARDQGQVRSHTTHNILFYFCSYPVNWIRESMARLAKCNVGLDPASVSLRNQKPGNPRLKAGMPDLPLHPGTARSRAPLAGRPSATRRMPYGCSRSRLARRVRRRGRAPLAWR